jgi:dipeptide/tripeptide permease
MSKSTITRLFALGIVTIIAGAVLLVAALWGVFASGVIVVGGPDVVEVNGGSTAWLLVGLALIAVLVSFGGFVAAVVSWIGALLNTFQLEDRTWFVLLLVLGLFSLGFIAMLAYVVTGPDSTRPDRVPSAAPTPTQG